MRHNRGLTVTVLVIAGLQLAACQQVSGKVEAEHPAQVKRVEGTEFSSVTLTEKAMQRLGLKTDEVREEKVTRKQQPPGERKVVPYSALIYDSHGQTWVYTSPSARTFVRHKVEVDHIQGDLVVLKDGPPTGTVVASVGVAELYGTEFKVGH
jgi:hypothetical protein